MPAVVTFWLLVCSLAPFVLPLDSPLVTQALLSRSLGSRLMTSVPHCCDLASLKVPQQPLGKPKCTILCSKTNDFAKPPVFQKCSLRAPLGPPRLPQGPPRAPQGASQGPPRGFKMLSKSRPKARPYPDPLLDHFGTILVRFWDHFCMIF